MCCRDVFVHAWVRPKVDLCWFHVNKNWQENSVKKVRSKGRRQEVIERLNEILHFNPGAGAGETCHLPICCTHISHAVYVS